MGQGICRNMDMATGTGTHGSQDCPHNITAFYMQGLQTVRVNGRAIQRVFDFVATNCPHGGHFGMAVGKSSTVRAGGLGVTRQNDACSFFCGVGMNVLGSTNVRAGG